MGKGLGETKASIATPQFGAHQDKVTKLVQEQEHENVIKNEEGYWS